jgi:hypothetical protein
MTAPAPVFWPFPVLPPEQQTTQHRREVEFLEAAYRDGFRPCKFADGEYRIESPDGRSAWVISRGRLRGGAATRWEVWLNDVMERVSTTWVDGFEAAAEVAQRWVRGVSATEALGVVGLDVSGGAHHDVVSVAGQV